MKPKYTKLFLGILGGLIVGNYISTFLVGVTQSQATERIFFQFIALLLVWILIAFENPKKEQANKQPYLNL